MPLASFSTPDKELVLVFLSPHTFFGELARRGLACLFSFGDAFGDVLGSGITDFDVEREADWVVEGGFRFSTGGGVKESRCPGWIR